MGEETQAKVQRVCEAINFISTSIGYLNMPVGLSRPKIYRESAKLTITSPLPLGEEQGEGREVSYENH